MPTNKEFKRLVRARMQKTGESYSTARSHLITKKQVPKPQPRTQDYAKLAGMSDARDRQAPRAGLAAGRNEEGPAPAGRPFLCVHASRQALFTTRGGVPPPWGRSATPCRSMPMRPSACLE